MVSDDVALRCVNHPTVETYVSCSTCGTPICPDCMVQAPVGIKCARCARQPRSALVRLRPRQAFLAAATAVLLGLGAGFVLALIISSSFGWGSFILAFLLGAGMGEVVKRASGYHRAPVTGMIAAGGAALAVLSELYLWLAIVDDHATVLAFSAFRSTQLIAGLFAAFIAYRRAT